MKVLERHDKKEEMEEYTIHTCYNCKSKLDILKEDCESEYFPIRSMMPHYIYTCKCPVCKNPIAISEFDWKKRPKQKENSFEHFKELLENRMSKIDSNSNSNKGEVTAFSFTPSPELIKWAEDHINAGCHSSATAGEHFQYEFLPSGIVECQTARCLVCGKKKTVYID